MDDDLRARLRAADPARHLTTHPRLEIPEDQMDTSEHGHGPGTDGRPHAGRIALVAAAAAVLVVAGIGVFAMTGDEPRDTTAGPTNSQSASPTPDATTTDATYSLPAAAPNARCIPPNPRGIGELDVAFRGTVVSVGESRVVLEPTEYYRGEPAERVALQYDGDQVISELLPVEFQQGKEYIVAVKAGEVQLCGYTAPARPGLEKMYAAAGA